MFLQPFKHTLTGHVHFRTYPVGEEVERVAVLSFDRTEYLYSPANSLMCTPVNDVQLDGFAEFPENIGENERVTVNGRLYEAASRHEHTRFAMDVITILPMRTLPAR